MFARSLLALILVSLPAVAAEVAPSEIQLSQRAERVVARDQIGATLRTEAKGNDPRQIQGDINRRMADALARAKKVSTVQVSSGGYSVQRAFDPKAPELWQASQNINLVSGNLDDCLALIGDLQAQGLVISNMHFFISPKALAAVQDELTSQAIRDLRARAERVAADFGMKVEAMKAVTVGNAAEREQGPSPRFAMAQASQVVPTPVAEAGETTVGVTVTATVLMAPH